MARQLCICGGPLGTANQHGIHLCLHCRGTTDRDGVYLADPRSIVVAETPYVAASPVEPAEPAYRDGLPDVETLCRAYLKAARAQQRLLLPASEWADLPAYDDLPPHHQNFVVVTMTQAIVEWLGLPSDS
jgi:hypothetical protein